jgi:signal peptidase II
LCSLRGKDADLTQAICQLPRVFYRAPDPFFVPGKFNCAVFFIRAEAVRCLAAEVCAAGELNMSKKANRSPGPSHEMPVPATRFIVFALVAALGCYLDLATKRWVFQWRGMPGERPIWWVWPGLVGIEPSLNTGALFGIGHNQVLWFAALSVVAFFGIIVWFVFGRIGKDVGLTIVLGCITGGILGNLYDRLGLWSIDQTGWPQIFAVRDWIRLSYGQYVWPNFNIADSLLVCSTAYLIGYSFWPPGRHGQAANAETAKAKSVN